LPTTALVSIYVFGAAAVILDSNGLDVHGEGSLGEIRHTTGPRAGSFGRWVCYSCLVGTSNPISHPYTHGCLGEVLPFQSQGIGVEECADEIGVDVPFDVRGRPINSVCMPCANRIGHRVVNGTVIGCGIAFSEKITFNRGII
jgi:hypothetical protein